MIILAVDITADWRVIVDNISEVLIPSWYRRPFELKENASEVRLRAFPAAGEMSKAEGALVLGVTNSATKKWLNMLLKERRIEPFKRGPFDTADNLFRCPEDAKHRAAHDDPLIGERDLFAYLQGDVLARAHQRRSDEFGADVAFSKALFVQRFQVSRPFFGLAGSEGK